MYTCMYVGTYIRMYVCNPVCLYASCVFLVPGMHLVCIHMNRTDAYMYTCTHAHVCMFVYVYMHTCMCMHMYMYVSSVVMHKRAYLYVKYVCVYTSTCVYAHVCGYVQIYVVLYVCILVSVHMCLKVYSFQFTVYRAKSQGCKLQWAALSRPQNSKRDSLQGRA